MTMKKMTLGVALGALMVSGALAQSPPSPSSPATSSPPAATSTPPSGGAADAGKADVVMSQKPDQWLASKFRGTDVLGADDQKIGDVSDILFDKTGKIEAFVISVGGFLGVGSKSVALAPSSFEVKPGQNGGSDQLKLSMSKEQLTTAQAFTPYEPPRATTGAAPGGGAMGGSPRPAGTTSPTSR